MCESNKIRESEFKKENKDQQKYESEKEREKAKNGISTMMLLEPDFNPLDINCILQLNGYFVASRHLTKYKYNNNKEKRDEFNKQTRKARKEEKYTKALIFHTRDSRPSRKSF